MKFTPRLKKWISVVSISILAAASITFPINVKSLLPDWVYTPIIANLSIYSVAAIVAVISIWWIANSETE